MTWPSVVATLVNPNATDKLNSPSHSSIHTAANNEIVQMETFIGTLSSAVGTLVYDIRASASNGGGHVQSGAKGGTGQTSYTKGDMLVAVNSSTLTKLAVGADNAVLTANSSVAAGVQWAGVPGTPTVTLYAVASTLVWVRPSVFSYLIVECQAGGVSGSSGNNSASGDGGAGGAYTRKVIAASLISGNIAMRIGAAANDSFFGSILSTAGGGNGDFNVPGAPGGKAFNDAGPANKPGHGGRGGDSFLGRGAQEVIDTSGTGAVTGGIGTGYGGGGGGAGVGSGSGAGTTSGGSGTPGAIVITQY